jgi:hypothetical protein
VGFVVDIVALGQDFSEYFGFPCQICVRLSVTPRNFSLLQSFKAGYRTFTTSYIMDTGGCFLKGSLDGKLD